MRFASLGSGSRGNATLVEVGDTHIMLDCGFSCSEAQKRLARLDLEASDIDAILVTHEHSDHISGVARFSRRFGTPVWMTAGTAAVHKGGELASLHVFSSHQKFSIGEIDIQPFPVPHDAREPCQFVFSSSGIRLGVLTDAGSVTSHMVNALSRSDALLLEFNHDAKMLAEGPYPSSLKHRVGGDYGHLSNQQAVDLLEKLDTSQLQHLVIAHISEKNNCPERVWQALGTLLSDQGVTQIELAEQENGFSWRQLN